MRREETTSAHSVSNVLRSKGGENGEKETEIDSREMSRWWIANDPVDTSVSIDYFRLYII